MNSGQKKGINFDLDTNALKIYYTEGDWRNAYHDVRNFLRKMAWNISRAQDIFNAFVSKSKFIPFFCPLFIY